MRWVAVTLSGLFLLFCAFAYAVRPDALAAFTIFPPWTWVFPGVLLLARPKNRRIYAIVAIGWLLFLVGAAEEVRSLLRGVPEPEKSGAWLRVVSLNCAGGDPKVAEEAFELRPDLVLLQESPGRKEVEALQKEHFPAGGSIHGPDGSILSQYPIRAVPLPRGTHAFVIGELDLPSAGPLRVVSLRLIPPAFRPDLVSPSAWTAVAQNRRLRREQLHEILAYLDSLPPMPTVIGGDFNATAGDRSLDAMSPRWEDAFTLAGRGWGHTAVNDYPLARIDRIFVPRGWLPSQVWAQKTKWSDHRKVIADLSQP